MSLQDGTAWRVSGARSTMRSQRRLIGIPLVQSQRCLTVFRSYRVNAASSVFRSHSIFQHVPLALPLSSSWVLLPGRRGVVMSARRLEQEVLCAVNAASSVFRSPESTLPHRYSARTVFVQTQLTLHHWNFSDQFKDFVFKELRPISNHRLQGHPVIWSHARLVKKDVEEIMKVLSL